MSLDKVIVGSGVQRINQGAFEPSGISDIYFWGDAPAYSGTIFTVEWDDWEQDVYTPTTVHYRPGTTGWGPVYSLAPTTVWNLPTRPQVSAPSINQNGQSFSFVVTGDPGTVVALEARDSLAAGNWTRLITTNLTDGAITLSDSEAQNHTTRFYRVVVPLP